MLVDTRSQEAWNQGHARGAVHIPKPDMPRRIPEYPTGTNFVVYCWGPGCNGAQRAGLIISELGYVVKEMIGGFEYWTREGLEIVDDSGPITRVVDILTAPRATNDAVSCDC